MPWLSLPANAVGLAPMAGISDSPFRQLCKEFGADFVFSEMISAAGLSRNPTGVRHDQGERRKSAESKSLAYARFEKKERPIVLQIFGHNPAEMAQAARFLVAKTKPDGIDINMGCPVRKVVNGGSGVALMDDPALAVAITRAVKASIGPIPLSVKTRLGNNQPSILELAPLLAEAGADLLIIHPRLRRQLFKGPLDYKTVGQVTKKISIPVMLSGGIQSKSDINHLRKITGARYFMVGQAALGNPFIFRQIKNPGDHPGTKEILATMLRHTERQIGYRQYESGAITEMRKHFAWYLRGFTNAARWRQLLVRCNTRWEVKRILLEIDRRNQSYPAQKITDPVL